MQIKIFTIPLSNTEVSEAEVNAFIRGHRVLQIDRHFSSEGGGYWTLFIEYMEGDPSGRILFLPHKPRAMPWVLSGPFSDPLGPRRAF